MAEVSIAAKNGTLITISNATELVGQILTSVAGNDISTSIRNQPLTRQLAYEYAVSIFGRELNSKIGNF